MAHRPRKKPLDGSNPVHVTLGLWLSGVTPHSAREDVLPGIFNSNNFVASAALLEACALLSVILVITL